MTKATGKQRKKARSSMSAARVAKLWAASVPAWKCVGVVRPLMYKGKLATMTTERFNELMSARSDDLRGVPVPGKCQVYGDDSQ